MHFEIKKIKYTHTIIINIYYKIQSKGKLSLHLKKKSQKIGNDLPK